MPAARQPATGFIFYPGGRVDARNYAPAARAVAAQGSLVVIVPMPFNLAVTNPAAVAAVIAAHPDIEQWARVQNLADERFVRCAVGLTC